MNAQYEIVKKFDSQYIVDGLPIYIESGYISKDNDKNAILIRIKFRNYGLKVVKAIQISCDCYGPSGEIYEPLQDYEYFNLNCMPGADFGFQEAVYVPDNRTYSVTVNINSVLFSDGTFLKEDYEFVELQKPIPIELPSELETYYFKCTSDKNVFFPVQYKHLWVCSCGAINSNEINKCRECKKTKKEIFLCNNLDNLIQECNSGLKKKGKQKRKRALLGSISVVVLIFGLKFAINQLYQYHQNNELYYKALKCIDDYDWDSAKNILKYISGFKDAREQYNKIDEKKQQHEYRVMEESVRLYKEGQYKNAYELLSMDNSYLNDFSEVDDIYYCYAKEQYSEEKYRYAMEILSKISDIWIADNTDDYYLLLGLTQYKAEYYVDASVSFSNITGTVQNDDITIIEDCKLKASEIAKEEKYQSLQPLLDVYKFDEALDILKEIEPYKDSARLIEIINNRRDGIYEQIDDDSSHLVVQTDIDVETLESKYWFAYVVNRNLDKAIEYYKQCLEEGDVDYGRHEKSRDGNIILVEEDEYTFEFKDNVTLSVVVPDWREGALKGDPQEEVFKKEASF